MPEDEEAEESAEEEEEADAEEEEEEEEDAEIGNFWKGLSLKLSICFLCVCVGATFFHFSPALFAAKAASTFLTWHNFSE